MQGGAGGQSTFYATSSNFEVEVVALGRIRERFKDLSRVREVGLEWEGVNGAGGEKEREEVRRELKGEWYFVQSSSGELIEG